MIVPSILPQKITLWLWLVHRIGTYLKNTYAILVVVIDARSLCVLSLECHMFATMPTSCMLVMLQITLPIAGCFFH